MVTALEDLLIRVGQGDGPDGGLDAAVHAWNGAAPQDVPEYTASLDAALALARQLLHVDGAECSFAVLVSIGGAGQCDIAVQTRPGNMREFRSDRFAQMPPRAVLQALFKALLA